MVLFILSFLLIGSLLTWQMWLRGRLGGKLSQAQICLPRWYLRTTHITIDASQVGQVIPVNDHLKFIRHESGRSAYLLMPRPPQSRPEMPKVLRAFLLTFFTL